jgi:dUTP pyrophosphatase
MNTKVKFVKVRPNAVAPTQGSKKSAGFDLSACLENKGYVLIHPHTTVKIPTGLAIQPPDGYFGAIFARSGIATKQGLRPANCVGVCDEDFRGEYMVALHNDSDVPQAINDGDRIAQLVFLPYLNVEFEEAEKLNETERGEGGFGSTGVGVK